MRNLSYAAQTRGTRIAMNAAMGVIKTRVVSNLKGHQDTGLLAKSQRVKVAVPQASKNPAHHDKPAWGLVGAGKGLAGIISAKGKGRVLSKKAKAAAKAAGTQTVMASRYSHFPEKKHHDLANAAQSARGAAQAKFASKAGQFIQAEAAKLASKP
jgi:hypothetical protein